MELSGDDDEERVGDNRYPKRQRRFSVVESEDEEDGEDVSATRMTEELSGSPEPAQHVKLKSSDVLDCPTCYEPLQGPIFQCINGHLACLSCCTKLNKTCSFCKGSIGIIRCRAMEMIIEASIVPCPNAKYGCKETTSYGNQSKLENNCAFARCFCPISNCDYFGSYTDLKSHALATHSCEENVLFPFVFDTPLNFRMNINERKKVILQEKKEGDLFVVQAFNGPSDSMYVTVKRIAPMDPGISYLSCSLAKINSFSTLRLGLIVKKINKVREEMDSKDEVMVILPQMSENNDFWSMQICIGIGPKYTLI